MDLLVNKAIEEDLIGLLLASPDQYWDVQDVITSESFGDPTCGAFYSAIQTVMKRGLATLPFSVVSQHFHGECETPPGVYLALLKSKAPMGVAATDLVTDIEDMAIRRAARKIMETSLKDLADNTKQARNVVQAVQSGSAALLSSGGDKGSSVGELAFEAYDNMVRAQKGEITQGIISGLPYWDALAGPLMPEDLVILGGATSIGKSALAAQVAISMARRGLPCLFLTHEMSKQQVTIRFISELSRVPFEAIIQGQINAQEDRLVQKAAEDLQGLPLWIESPTHPTVASDQARVMYYCKRHGLRCAFIDHLGYVETTKAVRDEFAGITDIVKGLKAAAKESKIPWVVLSHLNNEAEGRPNKRPILRDLYGSGEIKKSADIVLFVHREQYWLERSEPPRIEKEHDFKRWQERQYWEGQMARWAGRAEIILGKRRSGKGFGIRECEFIEKLTMFAEIGCRDKKDDGPVEQISLL